MSSVSANTGSQQRSSLFSGIRDIFQGLRPPSPFLGLGPLHVFPCYVSSTLTFPWLPPGQEGV